MKVTLAASEKRTISGRAGRKALVLYLKTGAAVYGSGSLTGTADALGAELAGAGVFNAGWTAGGTGWTLTAGYAEYSAVTAVPANKITRAVTGMSPHRPHKLVVTTANAVTGVYRVTLNGTVIAALTAVGTFEFIFYPTTESGELVIAPEERASAATARFTNVSVKAFTATEGIPLPAEQQVTFAANDPTSFAGPVTLCAGAEGAQVLVEEFM